MYKHTNKVNGKVYIGITSQNPVSRWASGRGYPNNAYFRSAIEKYGWDGFDHEVLYDGLTKGAASQLERELIALYRSSDRNFGYNIELGGYGREAVSDETREKLRQAMLGEKNPNYGKHLSTETRQKLSECNRGEKHPKYGTHHSAETREKLREQKLGERNPSYGKRASAETIERKREGAKRRKILCVETDILYRSVREASRQTGINIAGICLAAKGERLKTSGGYHWKYMD